VEDGSYMVEHTATMFLLGPGDEILDLIPYGASAAEIADVLARHR
jgi:cytochrome oxidase Cu insertion factor (SCO1/SenC/PrrC family)